MEKFGQLLQVWDGYFGQFCFCNKLVGQTLFHVFLGKAFGKVTFLYNNENMDLRIHLFLIQQSGTGKGQSKKPLKELAIKMGLKYHEYLQATDAGLVGTFQQNRNKPPTPIPGLLADADIIVFPEGEAILSEKQHSKDMIAVLQGVMDEPGSVSKRLALGSIEIPTKTAFYFTSYMVEDFNYALMEKGLFQRLFLIKRDVSAAERKEIEKAALESVHKEKVPIPQELEDAIEYLKKIQSVERQMKFAPEDYAIFSSPFLFSSFPYLFPTGSPESRNRTGFS